MYPTHLEINRVRGVDELSIRVQDLTTLIGPNNAGKSTILDAIRLFYGDLEWDDARDRPWPLDDSHPSGSYVLVTYELDAEEMHEFDFHADDSTLVLCRYFADTGPFRAGETYSLRGFDGIGFDDVSVWSSTAPPGTCVYVPALADLADHTRMAETSALREVMRRALHNDAASDAIRQVSAGLAQLRATLAHEDGPASQLERRLSDALSAWGIEVNVDIDDLTPELVLDRLLRLHVVEDGHRAPIGTQGTGVQRMALAALIQAAAELGEHGRAREGFTWVLFEEPETHLHPSHIGRLGNELARLARTGDTSIMITTHSMTLLAAQGRLDSVVRLHRGRVAAPSRSDVMTAVNKIRSRSAYTDHARQKFRGTPRRATSAQVESRMLRDLDARRSAALFADRVIVVEGYSDCALFEWLDRRGLLGPLGANVGVIDANGKYELHRVITTLSLFGIPHAVVWDEDAALVPPHETGKREKKARQDEATWQAIRAAANDANGHVPSPPYPSPWFFIAGGIRLAGTIESWLGIHEEDENAWKGTNLAAALDDAFDHWDSQVRHRVTALVTLLADLFDGKPIDVHRGAPHFRGCLIAPPFPQATVDFDDLPASG